MDDTYAEVGTEIVIGFGTRRGTRYTYLPAVRSYLCTRGLITETQRSSNGEGNIITWARVDRSNTLWWPVCDMILASHIDLLSPDQRKRIK